MLLFFFMIRWMLIVRIDDELLHHNLRVNHHYLCPYRNPSCSLVFGKPHRRRFAYNLLELVIEILSILESRFVRNDFLSR